MNLNYSIIIMLISYLSHSHLYPQKSAGEYIGEFESDAKRFGIKLYRREPVPIIVNHHLYVKNLQVDAYTLSNEIAIYFDSTGDMYKTNRKVLVYHELGHYYLHRVHTSSKSIMNIDAWEKPFDELSAEDQEYYIKEIFLGPYK